MWGAGEIIHTIDYMGHKFLDCFYMLITTQIRNDDGPSTYYCVIIC